jgi:hypothetical protein
LRRASRHTNDPCRPYECACVLEGRIALADVHAVCRTSRGEIRTVIEDEERAMVLARGPKRSRRRYEVFVGQPFLAQLHDVDSTAQRRVEERARILAARPRLED